MTWQYRNLKRITKETLHGKGLICSSCQCRHFVTTHTEPLVNGTIRRRRMCRNCGRRVVTTEERR